MISHQRRHTSTVAVMICLVLTMVLAAAPMAEAALSLVSPLPLSPIQINTPIIRPIILVAAPSELTATANGTSIALAWKDNSDNETSFEVERKSSGADYSKITSVTAGTISYTDSGLTANVQYTYRVKAVNSSTSSAYSNEASATAYTPVRIVQRPPGITLTPSLTPTVPARLSAVAVSESEINVSWADQSTNEIGFRLERKDAAQGYTEIAVLSQNTIAYKDTGLKEKTVYSYRIRSFNNTGISSYSNEASAQTLAAAAAASTPGSGTTPGTVINNITNINNTTNTTNSADTNINITGSTISNSNIASNNQISQTTNVSNQNGMSVTQNLKVLVNGQKIQSDVDPFINDDGRTMLPIRAIADALGVQVYWDDVSRTALLTQGMKIVQVPIGQQAITVNGSQVPMDTTAAIKDGRTMLPVRAVGEAFGAKIGWDENTRTVNIVA